MGRSLLHPSSLASFPSVGNVGGQPPVKRADFSASDVEARGILVSRILHERMLPEIQAIEDEAEN
jgi:hypothetical protein